MKNDIEIQCLICENLCKNNRSLFQHIRYQHNITSEEYRKKYLGEFIDPESQTSCPICGNYYNNKNGLGIHMSKIHKISHQEFYDTFYKKEGDGLCLTCGKNTRFIDTVRGYVKHCSSKCCNNNPEVIQKIQEKRTATFKAHPEIQERINKIISTWIKEHPEEYKKAIIKRSQTFKENPQIQQQRVEKYKKIYGKGTEKRNRANIKLRNKYAELQKSDSTIPYFLYIIHHTEKPIIKIGRSECPENRLGSITKDFGDCKIIRTIEGPYNRIQPMETFLHDYFDDFCRVQPKGMGRTEWFDECILSELMEIV